MQDALPICLTIAGSDSGGGAGIQADLKAFTALETHGMSVVTAVTAQNPHSVLSIHPVPPEEVVLQLQAVCQAFRPAAVKTGMLHSAAVIQAVVEQLQTFETPIPLVVDPVMVATSGAALTGDDFLSALRQHLLPRATVITPNIPEAETLVGMTINERGDMLKAVTELASEFDAAVLLKGGHSKTSPASDMLAHDHAVYELRTPVVNLDGPMHGTGCTLSAVIAAMLANGRDVPAAIRVGKQYLYKALEARYALGDGSTLAIPDELDESVVFSRRVR